MKPRKAIKSKRSNSSSSGVVSKSKSPRKAIRSKKLMATRKPSKLNRPNVLRKSKKLLK